MDLTTLLRTTLISVSEDAVWRVLQGKPVRLDAFKDGRVRVYSKQHECIAGVNPFYINKIRPNKERKPDGLTRNT